MTRWQDRHKVIPAVFMIFHRGDEVLLLRRANTGFGDGWYSLPAGHVDGNEPAVKAACREAREEVGAVVTLDDLRLVHLVHERSDGHERLNMAFDVLRYRGKISNAEPDKCDELRWANPNALPPNTLPQVRAFFAEIAAGRPYSHFNFD